MSKIKKITDSNDTYNSEPIDEMLAMITPEEQEDTDIKMMMAVKIYDALQRKGWSQNQLATAMNKQVSAVSKWLNGGHNFTMETLISIQRILDIKLLNVEENEVPDKLILPSKAMPISNKELHQLIEQKSGMRVTRI